MTLLTNALPIMAKSVVLDDMPHMTEARSIEDDWAGISNLAIRKRTQNRLNQRALRRRREAMKSAHFQQHTAETIRSDPALSIELDAGFIGHLSSDTTWILGQQAVSEQIDPQPSQLSKTPRGNPLLKFRWDSGPEGALRVVSVGPTTIVLNLYSLPADHLLTLVRYNLYRACAENAKILGLDPRSMHDDITSPFCDLKPFNHSLPRALLPTETQIAVRHHPYIDIFPFGSLRDKLILAEGTVDEYELCADLGGKNSTTEHTGLIVWGDPWDPMAWELSEYVAIKWGRLFGSCETLLTATNYWRRQRGEPPLTAALFRL
ncbi:hypothetical protein F4859DRAFT_487295 [Xylaria cf. heliscus]|nr:hypothetical protein F4859DRAFT_487295 [Xylaria cf. heliscus]